MDPVSFIVTALALGANTSVKEAFSEAGKDAYTALKRLIGAKYPHVSASVAQLEEHPDSKARRDVVAEELQTAAAGDDRDLRAFAQALLEAVRRDAPETATAIGLDLERVTLANLNLKDSSVQGSSGTGIRMRDSEVSGNLVVENLRVEGSGRDAPKKA
jgi:hypothetical protein